MGYKSANHFLVKGHELSVRYFATGTAGVPTLEYSEGGSAKSFSGEQIHLAETALGTEVTVTLVTVPDGWVESFTLVLPEVHVTPGNPERVAILGIKARTKTSIAGPEIVKGALTTYVVIHLVGTAELVRT